MEVRHREHRSHCLGPTASLSDACGALEIVVAFLEQSGFPSEYPGEHTNEHDVAIMRRLLEKLRSLGPVVEKGPVDNTRTG